VPPWDATAACEVDAAIDAACGREYDAVASLLERLVGRRDASDPLTWRGLAWVDPAALKPLLSPSLLLRVSPPLAAQLLRHLASGLRSRLSCAEGAVAAGASLALTRLLGYLEEEAGVLYPAAPAGGLPAVLQPLLEAALELLGCVLAHHTAPAELQVRARVRVPPCCRRPDTPVTDTPAAGSPGAAAGQPARRLAAAAATAVAGVRRRRRRQRQRAARLL